MRANTKAKYNLILALLDFIAHGYSLVSILSQDFNQQPTTRSRMIGILVAIQIKAISAGGDWSLVPNIHQILVGY